LKIAEKNDPSFPKKPFLGLFCAGWIALAMAGGLGP
jgi:hypothetical protein